MSLSENTQLACLMQRSHFLYLLNDAPERQTDNWNSQAARDILKDCTESQRVLSLRQERRLSEAFAFIAARSDDPRKVVAACVEEGSDGKSLTIKLAVNNGGLEAVQAGFENMGKILQRIHENGMATAIESHS